MTILRSVLIIIEILSSFLLIGVILIQKSKSEGLGLAFGSGMGETLFGSRAGNVLTRITIGLSVVFLGNTLFLALIFAGSQQRSLMSRETGGVPMAQPAPPPAAARPATAPLVPGAAPTLPGTRLDGSAPAAAPSAPAPAGTPTLPGVKLDETPTPAPAPAEAADSPDSEKPGP